MGFFVAMQRSPSPVGWLVSVFSSGSRVSMRVTHPARDGLTGALPPTTLTLSHRKAQAIPAGSGRTYEAPRPSPSIETRPSI